MWNLSIRKFSPALATLFLFVAVGNSPSKLSAQQPSKEPATEKKSLNLSGKWIDSAGREYDITQKDEQIVLRTETGEQFKSAKGLSRDRNFELRHTVNQKTIKRELPEWLKRELLFKQEILIRGKVSEDGGTINAEIIDYDVEGDPDTHKITRHTEVKTPLSLTLRRAVILDVEVMDDQSKKYYPFKKDSPPTDTSKRRLFIIGKNLPKSTLESIHIVSHDPTVSYEPFAIEKESSMTETFNAAWKKALVGLSPEQQQRYRDFDAMFVDVTLHKGVLPGRQEFTLSGGDGDWVLRFADTKARIQFIRKTSVNEFEDIENIYLPEKLMLEVRSELDLPLDKVTLIVGNNEQTVNVVADSVPGHPKIYRTPPTRSIAVVPKDEPLPRFLEATDLLNARDNDQIVARMVKQDLLQASPAVARVADDPGHLWLTAMRKAAKCAGKSDEQAYYAQPNELAEPTVSGFDVKIGDHAAMLLLRDGFIEMMQAEAKNLNDVRTNYGLLYGFRQMLFAMKWDQNSPWSRIKVTGPSGEEIWMGEAVENEFLTKHFKNNDNAAEQWSLNAIREGVDKYRETMATAIAEARGTRDCDVEKLLELTGVGYDAVVAHLMPRLLTKELDEWVPDKVARAWVGSLHTLANAVKAQQDLNKLYRSAALGLAAAFAPLALEGFISELALYAVNAAPVVADALLEIRNQLKVRKEVEFALGGSAVLGTGRLTEAELEKQPWWNVMRSILLQAGALTEFSLLASELKSLASAARGSELSTVVLEGGTKAFQKLSKEELADFMAFAARAKILQTEKGVEALSVAQRRSLLAFDRLAQDASQASVATSAAALAKPAAKVVEPNAARPSEPVSMSDKVAPPTEPGATPRSATEPRPAAEPTGPVASGPKPAPEPVRPGVEPPRAAGEPPGPIASGPKPAAEPDAPTVVVQPRVDPDAPTAVGPAPQPRSAPPVAGPTVPSPPIRAPPAGAPGSLENPLRGDDIVKQAFQLAGRTIRLPLGEPITVGNPVGSGGFNIVYEIKGQPDRLLKILKNPDPNISPASVLRQVNGYDLIKGDPTIPSAKIYSSGASRGGTSYLVVEDLNYGAWAQKNVKINVVSPNQAQLAAVEELYQNLGRRGLIWPDGKLDNIFFFEEAGKIRAGILDHDFIFRTKGLSEADIELMAWTFRGKPGSGAAVIDALGSPTWDASRFNDIMFKGLYKPPQ